MPPPAPGATSRSWKGPLETTHFVIDLDPQTGAINRLQNKKTGREWATKSNLLGLFSYQTLSQADYDRFFASYIKSTADWAFKDFGKPNIGKFGARSQEWLPTLGDLHLEETSASHRIIATLKINDQEALDSGRAAFPRRLYVELILPHAEPLDPSQRLLLRQSTHPHARSALAQLQPRPTQSRRLACDIHFEIRIHHTR